jgi:uncharacterized protein YkwD
LLGAAFGLIFAVVSLAAAADFETRKQEIIARYEYAKPAYSGSEYDEMPSVRSPYSTGKVNDGYLADGLKMFNFYRFLAGVPDDAVLDDGLTYRAQHGAVLLAASGVFSHYPPQPADMDDAFYDEGLVSTSSSNISYWSISPYFYDNLKIDSALSGQMDDEDATNIDRIGHRRWILSYELKKTAFGVANSGNARYFTVQVFDRSRDETDYPNYTLWPNESAFPQNFFNGDVPWSIQLNHLIYAAPSPQEVTVTLTRRQDSRAWTFTKSDTDKSGKYFNINSEGYGSSALPYCIIFRPDGVGSYTGFYDVSVSGLKYIDGSPAVFDYTVEFFDIPGIASDPDDPYNPTNPDYDENTDYSTRRQGESGGGCSTGAIGLSVIFVLASMTTRGKKNIR